MTKKRREAQRRRVNRPGANLHRANRKYKDRLFIRIFESREDLLRLYNAVNDSD